MKARPRGTDGTLLASLPWTLTALFVSLVAHFAYLPIWITIAFVACATWRYVIEKHRRLLPSPWLRAGLALACFLGVFGTYSSISGVGPGSALLAIMAALKLLETRRRRDQFVLLFISIFLVMSSLLREQHLWSLPYLITSTLIIMTAWLRMSANESEALKQSFVTAGRLLLYAAPIAVTMWVFFPRLASPFWAVPIDTSRATTGISDTMSPGDVSSLSSSDQVAFRVRFYDAIPAARDRYWRGLVLTRFNGRTWMTPEGEPLIGSPAAQQLVGRGPAVTYEITMEPTRQHWLFALEMPLEYTIDDNSFMGRQQQLARTKAVDQRIAYEVVSHIDFRVQPELTERQLAHYTRIPRAGNIETIRLAQKMRDSAGSQAAFVDAVMSKFNQEEFFYTLEPPPLGADPIDQFLFETRRGFCEHYASAFTFMMRSAGVPARVVLGYQGGEVNPLGGHLIVRQSDAHAWSEVWLEGYGWYRVDPTSAVAPERIEYGTRDPAFGSLVASWGFAPPSQLWQNLTMTLDVLDAKWNDFVLGYGPDKQDEFMEWLGMDDPNWRKMLLTMLVIVIAIIAAISGLLMLRYRSPTKDHAARLYDRFIKKTGIELQVGETAIDFAGRVRRESALPSDDVESVTTAYLDARYGPANEHSLTRLRQAVSAIG